jgi:hypothetical protein
MNSFFFKITTCFVNVKTNSKLHYDSKCLKKPMSLEIESLEIKCFIHFLPPNPKH